MNVSHETIQKKLDGYTSDRQAAESRISELEGHLVNLRKIVDLNNGAAMACRAILEAPAVEESNVETVSPKKKTTRKRTKK